MIEPASSDHGVQTVVFANENASHNFVCSNKGPADTSMKHVNVCTRDLNESMKAPQSGISSCVHAMVSSGIDVLFVVLNICNLVPWSPKTLSRA